MPTEGEHAQSFHRGSIESLRFMVAPRSAREACIYRCYLDAMNATVGLIFRPSSTHLKRS